MRTLGLAALLLLAPSLGRAAMSAKHKSEILSHPAGRLESYAFDPKVSLERRLKPCPPFLLEGLRDMDGRPDYEAYAPAPAERALIAQALSTLPSKMHAALTKRLVGIFFIKNFMGNGLSSWVLDGQGEVYAYLVINPAGFGKTISQTLTDRDASLFQTEAGLSIDAGAKYRGIIYTVLHEGTHAYDYVSGITPFVEPQIVELFHGGKGGDASWDVWRRYTEPNPGRDLPLRGKLKFYGLGGRAPLKASQAPELYAGLAKAPFASLYGSQSWAEDAADLVTFYHLTQVLKQPYVIRLNGQTAVEPMKGPALERARRVYLALSGVSRPKKP